MNHTLYAIVSVTTSLAFISAIMSAIINKKQNDKVLLHLNIFLAFINLLVLIFLVYCLSKK